MPIAVSITGGASHNHSLSAAERLAAQHALSKLGSTTNAAKNVGLVGGHGSETSVGTAAATAATSATTGHSAPLSTEAIKVAGQTASTVKTAETSSKTAATITLSDKTTVTLTGVATHNVIKTH